MDVRALATEANGGILALCYLTICIRRGHYTPVGLLYQSSDSGDAWVVVDTVTARTELDANS
jgi:hypothetical protein